MELVLFLIALQLAVISTALFVGMFILIWALFIAPPASPTMPFLMQLSDDALNKKATTSPATGVATEPVVHGMYV